MIPAADWDVVIVGGGVAGAAAAALLAEKGARVALLETHAVARWKIGETLAPEARPYLRALGVWDAFVAAGHLPCHGNVSAWGSDEAVAKDFIFNPHGNAWQLDRVAFEEMLLDRAVRAGVRVLRGRREVRLEMNQEQWRVTVGAGLAAGAGAEEETINARWVVDATGRRSLAARQLGETRQAVDELVAIYAVIDSGNWDAQEEGRERDQADEDSRTFIESCADGWWYAALMPGGRRTVSFQTDADLLPGQEWRSLEWFRERLGRTRHLSSLTKSTSCRFMAPPKLTSAHSARLTKFSGSTSANGCAWLAVGDAAMSFDPLSGQGLLRALQSGALAAEVIANRSAAALSQFNEKNETLWRQYAAGRLGYYAIERRWRGRGHEFWRRRHAGISQMQGMAALSS